MCLSCDAVQISVGGGWHTAKMAECQVSALLLEIKNALYPEVTANVGLSVRLRSKPVMNKVKKVHGSAYMLANISRNLCSSIQESVLIVPLMAQIRSHLSYPIEFSSDGSGFCSFDEIQRRGMDNLKQALLRTIDKAQSTGDFPTEKVPTSRIKQISVSSVVNKRRRQEDRWFFEPDLVAYAPIDGDREENLSKLQCHDYPQIVGCGVFDGHGGPEAAEHCSNLAPFLLSRHLQQRFLETSTLRRSSETIPDILTRVIHELNFSVAECHRQKLWNSGTTATICLIYGDYIYTVWIGDSQGVLFGHANNATKSTSSHQSSNEPVPQKEPIRLTEASILQTAPSSAPGTTTIDIPHIDEAEMAKSGKKHTPRPLIMGSIESPSIAASALISPTSPRTRAARWGLSFAWLTSLVRGGGGNSASSKELSPSEVPQAQLRVRAPLATQEVEESELMEVEDQPTTPVPVSRAVVHSVARVPFRYGSLPIGKKKERQHNHHQQGTGGGGGWIGGVSVATKRLSAHFSEPSLNVASAAAGATATVDPTTIALSAGHRISPAGDMRDSRSTSVVERSPSDSLASAYNILTPRMHRPEYAVEFVSILRAGGCVTFKASEDYVGGGEEDDDEGEGTESSQPSRIPAPVMSSAQLLFVPDLSVGGTYRVGGISGVTRSLGASTSLIPGLSGLPSLSAHRFSVSACLILATDGLWDTYGCSPDDLTHFFSGTPNREFAKLLTARAVRNGSSDNVTTLVLWLGEGGTDSEAMEVDLRSPTAYPAGTRCASVPSLGNSRLRGPLAARALGETDFSLPCYVEPRERTLTRSHSSEYLADVDRIRASSPMRVLP
ncbi:hypothetical protein ECG_01748 [Echinococcus granulosus]|nr:hypothetical protein ECG_01748 [Echinococcus granulosus]